MTRMWSLVVGVQLMVTGVADGGQLRELMHAKYSDGGTISRLALTFDSPTRFLMTRLNGQQVRLTFPQTGSAKYASGVPLVFKTGNASSASFDFSRRDTLSMLISLRKNVSYDICRSAAQVILEMYPIDTAQAALPVIDIRSLARKQINTAQTATTPIRNSFDIRLMPLAVSLVFSLITTGVFLFMVVRPSFKPQHKQSHRPVARTAESTAADDILAQARLIIREKSGIATPPRAVDSTTLELEDNAMTLARKFHRGQGELELARTFESKNRQYAWDKQLQRLNQKKTGREFVTAAKQLGVGRGEIGLAMSLRRLKDTSIQKESLT